MRLTEKVHQILAEQLQPGDLVIDATAGNGHDTQFLAEQTGTAGHVIAIDIQASAIESTRQRLISQGLEQHVTLYTSDHAAQLEALRPSQGERVTAVVFNLGYLPGSDKAVQTQSNNTRKALEASLHLLRPAGLLCVTAYRGHPGGAEESQAVETWMRLQENSGHLLECYEPQANNTPPILWVLHKR
ncbi:class I SAM-dependent methyltransferase [Coraliomargarita sp. SDUM461004]|uniref:Class I SAM-dependent methyltransferase n=1 Tax=Thalassobacterium sedimentorum TaxID=3041258 RepID=A0ABU1AI16_9BACT|nr:class I SAM-dependent methyltransferase [Coraliomargarita sp. SDUM461004]MDQ8194430.1 class I SAM-dependent methyltransferase [Coraliomargarita sp. SDUM461004]